MELDNMIKQLNEEGKSLDEIAGAIVSHEDVKTLNEEEIVELAHQKVKAIKAAEAAKKLQAKLDDEEEEKRAKSELSQKVDEAVEEKLKSINVSPSDLHKQPNQLKRFNKQTLELEAIVTPTESYSGFNHMLKCLSEGDVKSAKSISKEIDSDNDRIAKLQGKAPAVSDVDNRGGYSVPTEVNEMIMQLTYNESVVLPRTFRDPVMMEDKIYPTINAVTVDYIADQSTALSESAPTMSNPTVDMYRVGAFSDISNTIIQQKGADITNAWFTGYSSAFARFIDEKLIQGNITGASEKIDGLIWDANTNLPTAVALSSLSLDTLESMEEALESESDPSRTVWIGNRKVRNAVRHLDTTGGDLIFKSFANGESVEPLGYEFLLNTKITNVLDVGGDNNTGGTDTVLMLADLSKFVTGIEEATRIQTSEHFKFTTDVMTIRGIKRVGWKLLFSNTAVAQELTGAS